MQARIANPTLWLITAATLMGLLSQSATAADNTWQGDVTSDWNTQDNWDVDSVPDTPSERAVFDGTGTNSVTFTGPVGGGTGAGFGGILVTGGQASALSISNTANSALNFRIGGGTGITIDSNAGAFTLQATGGAASGIQFILNSTATYTFSNNSANTATLSLGSTASSRILPGGSFTPTVVFTGSGVWDVDTSIQDGGGSIALTKSGIGTLNLLGASSYSGDTRLTQGTLAVGHDSALGTSTFIITGTPNSTFRSANANDRTIANNIVMGVNTIFGSSTTGNLLFTGNVDAGGQPKIFTINNTVTEFSGVISGSGDRTKSGSGTLILSGENDYTGNTRLTAGTLAVGHDSALGPSGQLVFTVASNSTFRSKDAIDRTIANDVVFGVNAILGSASTGDLLFTGNVNTGSTTKRLTIENTQTEFSGIISGSGLFEQAGSGTLVLSGDNTYTGDTRVLTGTLAVGHDHALGPAGTLIFPFGNPVSTFRSKDAGDRMIGNDIALGRSMIFGSAGTGNLLFTGDVDAGGIEKTFTINNDFTEFSGIISGSGDRTKSGPGTLIFSGPNTYSGTTTINDGTLVAANKTALGTNNSNSAVRFTGTTGVLEIRTDNGPGDLDPYNVLIGTNSAGTIASDVKTGTVAINHTLGTFTAGAGTLNVIRGPNVASGSPSITFPSLLLDAGLGGTTTLNPTTADLLIGTVTSTSNNAKTLELTGTSTGSEVTGIISDGVNVVSLTKAGTGTWTLSGANAYSGDTRLERGTLAVGHDSALGPSGQLIFTINPNSTFRSKDASDRTIANDVVFGHHAILGSAGTGNLLFTGNVDIGTVEKIITINNVVTEFTGVVNGSGGLTKSGPGTLILSGPNTYTGDTRVLTGALAVGNDQALGSGTLIFPFGNPVSTFRSEDASDRMIDNNISLGRSMIFGTADTGNLLFTGDVDAGSLDKTFTIDNDVTEFSGVISGDGGRIKSGPGTMIFSGANTYTGLTSIDEGTLLINGSVISDVDVNSGATLGGTGSISGLTTLHDGGTVSPGESPGTLMADDFNWQIGGIYHWEINDSGGTAGQDPGWDLLDLTGGDLEFVGDGPFFVNIEAVGSGFAINSPFEIARADNILNFAADNFTLTASGDDEWSIFQQGNSIFLQVAVVPEPSSVFLFAYCGAILGLLGLLRAARQRTATTARDGIAGGDA